MRFGLVCMLAVSAMDSQEDSCDDDDQLALLHLRSRLSKAKSPPLCKDVDDALWEPLCKNWRLVISEGVYAKATQVCCSAIPVPCQLPGHDCSTGDDCVAPSCRQLEWYLQFFETRVVEVLGSVAAARECFFSTAKECGDEDAPMDPTSGSFDRGLIAAAVEEKTGDVTKEVEIVEHELQSETKLLQATRSAASGLANRASSGTRAVVSTDSALSWKTDEQWAAFCKDANDDNPFWCGKYK
mmetsp:Transcript_51459/g.117010  ORF Transcript_51459/g.117010 Transcript_51459/m.117010 type:complete len:241 (+) Transcript_51459:83-805(+)